MTETQNTSRRPGALIAMSGGVDSSVAAWLMQQAGYDCTGITMRLTRNETLGQSGFHTCCSEKDIEDAAEVAFAMDIPYEVLDFTADFREQIIEKFVRVYEAGGTPNPCIDCNKYMKFRHLLDWARAHGMWSRATMPGWSRTRPPAVSCSKRGWTRARTRATCSTTSLRSSWRISVCRWAACTRLRCARSRSSTNLSMPASTTVRTSASCRMATMPALWRTSPANTTRQVIFWTSKDMQANTVTVGPEEMLFDRIVYADEVNWIAIPELTGPLRVTARTRYHQVEQAATVYPAECGFRLEFDQPQRAPTPGQAVVLYQGDTVLGGGTITRVEK